MTLNCIFVVAFRIFIIQFSHNANKIVTVVVIVNNCCCTIWLLLLPVCLSVHVLCRAVSSIAPLPLRISNPVAVLFVAQSCGQIYIYIYVFFRYCIFVLSPLRSCSLLSALPHRRTPPDWVQPFRFAKYPLSSSSFVYIFKIRWLSCVCVAFATFTLYILLHTHGRSPFRFS